MESSQVGPHTEHLAEKHSESPDIGVIVIWEIGRNDPHAEKRVLDDLRGRFDVLAINECEWPQATRSRNFERFYCDRDYRGEALHAMKGGGPFVVVVARDERPKYDYRNAPQGRDYVNVNFYDAKQVYRLWLNSKHAIHVSDHRKEGLRDLTLLFGNDAVSQIEAGRFTSDARSMSNTFGIGGWDSLQEAFSVLNVGVRYVLLSGRGDRHGSMNDGSPLQILTDEYQATARLLDATPKLALIPKWGGEFTVVIAERNVDVEIRFVGDDYLGRDLAKRLLNNRVLEGGGYYVPSSIDEFELDRYRSIAYASHATSSNQHVKTLTGGGKSAMIHVPKDPTVLFDFRRAGYRVPALRSFLRKLNRHLHAAAIFVSASHLSARAYVLKLVPGLRYLRRKARKLSNAFGR